MILTCHAVRGQLTPLEKPARALAWIPRIRIITAKDKTCFRSAFFGANARLNF